MCVITDQNNKVVSLSIIPGLDPIPKGFHCYFPVDDLPAIGSIYINPEAEF